MFELIDFLIVNPIINILLVIYNYIGDRQISYLATRQKTICSDEVDA